MDYNELVLKIKDKDPFALSRWGDGEWLNIRKAPGTNCDGNIYYPDLGDYLEKIANVNKIDPTKKMFGMTITIRGCIYASIRKMPIASWSRYGIKKPIANPSVIPS